MGRGGEAKSNFEANFPLFPHKISLHFRNFGIRLKIQFFLYNHSYVSLKQLIVNTKVLWIQKRSFMCYKICIKPVVKIRLFPTKKSRVADPDLFWPGSGYDPREKSESGYNLMKLSLFSWKRNLKEIFNFKEIFNLDVQIGSDIFII